MLREGKSSAKSKRAVTNLRALSTLPVNDLAQRADIDMQFLSERIPHARPHLQDPA